MRKRGLVRDDIRAVGGSNARLATVSAAVCAVYLAALPALAANADGLSSVNNVDLPAQPLATSLKQLADQTGMQILFEEKAVAGIDAPALKARASGAHAFDTLLARTDLEYTTQDHTVAIRRKHAPPSEPGNALRIAQATPEVGPASGNSTSADTTALADDDTSAVQEVVVTGSRLSAAFSSPTPVTAISTAQLAQASPGMLRRPSRRFHPSPAAYSARTPVRPEQTARYQRTEPAEPARARGQPHARIARRRTAWHHQCERLRRHQYHSAKPAQTRRYRDRGCFGKLWLGCCRRRRQFRHRLELPRLQGRCQRGYHDLPRRQQWQALDGVRARVRQQRPARRGFRLFPRKRDRPGAHRARLVDNPYFAEPNPTPGGRPTTLVLPNGRISNGTYGGLITAANGCTTASCLALVNQQFGPNGVLQPFTPGAYIGTSFASGGDGAYGTFGVSPSIDRQNLFCMVRWMSTLT